LGVLLRHSLVENSHTDILPASSIPSTTNTFVTAYTNPVHTAEAFNEYFLSLANRVITNISSNLNNYNPTDNVKTFNDYLSATLYVTFPIIRYSPVSMSEIENDKFLWL
jgi:alpha-ketoglutarate-dependent taurine dioxygenase